MAIVSRKRTRSRKLFFVWIVYRLLRSLSGFNLVLAIQDEDVGTISANDKKTSKRRDVSYRGKF